MANSQPGGCCEPGATLEADDSTARMTCYCPVDDVMHTIRKKYTMQIIALLGAHGPVRYGGLRDHLDAPSDATLSDRLSQLADAGLVARDSYNEVPPRVEYSLTTSGRELEDRLQPLLQWATQIDAD